MVNYFYVHYHLGIPSFSMNLFSVPKVKEEKKKEGDVISLDDVEKMSSDDFIALGEEKIDSFLKANNAPDRFSAKGTIEMMKSGKFSPKQMVGMMKQMPKPEKEDELSETNKALKVLHNAYPELTKLDVVGKSEEGREIYALTINNPKTGNELSKPGVYVDGNIHGNEVQAGEVCLYYANMLLTKYGENEKATKVLDKNAHYIIPVVNVDERYHFFEDGNTPSSSRSIRVPKDDDGDGLFDEDAPDDLDGDGSITQMRIKDPFGDYKEDSEDKRIMVRVKPGGKGEYSILGSEGIDNDGDGKFNEDAEGYLDPNRNWGFNWMPPYVQSGAGNFPLSTFRSRIKIH